MTVHLNRKLSLETAVRVPDGAGGFTETWTAKGTVWAALKPGSGRERFDAQATISKQPYRIVIRSAPVGSPQRPQPTERFREDTRIFAIVGVAEWDPDGRYLTCFANEEVVG